MVLAKVKARKRVLLLYLVGPKVETIFATLPVPSLQNILESSAKTCQLPDQWKVARLRAEFKKGNNKDRACCRPLFMLSIPSKIMEYCVAGNITNHFADNKMLDKRQ